MEIVVYSTFYGKVIGYEENDARETLKMIISDYLQEEESGHYQNFLRKYNVTTNDVINVLPLLKHEELIKILGYISKDCKYLISDDGVILRPLSQEHFPKFAPNRAFDILAVAIKRAKGEDNEK